MKLSNLVQYKIADNGYASWYKLPKGSIFAATNPNNGFGFVLQLWKVKFGKSIVDYQHEIENRGAEYEETLIFSTKNEEELCNHMCLLDGYKPKIKRFMD